MHIIHKRQGQMSLNQSFFYTVSIVNFLHLLKEDACKKIIINSLQYLVLNDLAKIYGFVIMPNHIHLLWYALRLNGKETVAGSFAKFTAHQFKEYLLQYKPDFLQKFTADKRDRKYQFWKRDPLAIPISNDNILIQKLNYIHQNPVKEKWALCANPEDYKWSSARFYSTGEDEFKMLTHFRD